MVELFQTDRTSIVRHINNVYKVEELDRESTCAKIAQVQTEGKRTVKRNISYFQFSGLVSLWPLGRTTSSGNADCANLAL